MRIDKLSLAYPPKPPIIKNISIMLPQPGVFALMGPSGLGKTSLLKAIAGLLPMASNSISGLEGRRVTMMFQEHRLLPWRSALTNVMLGMPVPDAQQAGKLLNALEIEDLGAYPDALSGGMQRRVALARALAHGGEVLLLDEPFTGMDEALKERAARLILAQGAALIIFSTHEQRDAALMQARQLLLHQDRIDLMA